MDLASAVAREQLELSFPSHFYDAPCHISKVNADKQAFAAPASQPLPTTKTKGAPHLDIAFAQGTRSAARAYGIGQTTMKRSWAPWPDPNETSEQNPPLSQPKMSVARARPASASSGNTSGVVNNMRRRWRECSVGFDRLPSTFPGRFM